MATLRGRAVPGRSPIPFAHGWRSSALDASDSQPARVRALLVSSPFLRDRVASKAPDRASNRLSWVSSATSRDRLRCFSLPASSAEK
jgi:hypothetical protein